MNGLTYQKLTVEDIPAIVKLRIQQLKDEGAVETCDLEPYLIAYFTEHLSDNSFISWTAKSENKIIATSGMSFVSKPPYYNNPTGKVGLVSSMYTSPEYRRKGIARKLLSLIIDETKSYGCGVVHITASDIGVSLYRDYGFVPNQNFLQYQF